MVHVIRLIFVVLTAAATVWWWQWATIPKLIGALVLVPMILLSILMVDAWIGDLKRPDNPNLVLQRGAYGQRLLVYFPGLNNSARITSAGIMAALELRPGDRLFVEYPAGRFDMRDIARQVADYIVVRGYKQVEFLGSSMGSMLTAETLRQQAPGVKAKAILVCGLAAGSDAKLPAWLLPYFTTGPLLERLLPTILRLQYKRPSHIEPGVSEATLREHERYMWEHPGTFDQGKALHRFKPVQPSEFPNVPTYIIWTENDVLVKDQAHQRLAEAFPHHQLRQVTLGHATFVEQPWAWSQELVMAFAWLDQQPWN